MSRSPAGRSGKVLRATFGCNPNSSSLGVDVTFLLFGATFASALALGLGALLRRSRPGTTGAAGATGTEGSGPAAGGPATARP
jgi:hypothetical protein